MFIVELFITNKKRKKKRKKKEKLEKLRTLMNRNGIHTTDHHVRTAAKNERDTPTNEECPATPTSSPPPPIPIPPPPRCVQGELAGRLPCSAELRRQDQAGGGGLRWLVDVAPPHHP